jgi:hypothetical protein
MTSTTRAALERLIETWRVEAERGRFPTSVGVPRLDYTERAYAHVECADELAALLTAEGPAPTTPLAVYRCRVCGTRWLFWRGDVARMTPGTWNLLDQWQRPGSCCDNAPMGEQMEFLRDIVQPAEGPAPEPTIRCTVVELNGKTLAAPCAIEERCMYSGPPSREALAARLTDDVLARALIVGAKWDTGKVRTVLLDAICPQEPT